MHFAKTISIGYWLPITDQDTKQLYIAGWAQPAKLKTPDIGATSGTRDCQINRGSIAEPRYSSPMSVQWRRYIGTRDPTPQPPPPKKIETGWYGN